MARQTLKESERKERRDQILDAAEKVIASKGFKGATMDEIAAAADVAKGTLYLHFSSKSMVYIAICERGSRILNEKMAQVLSWEITGLKMIEELGNTYLEFVSEYPVYFQSFNYYEQLIAEKGKIEEELGEQCRENAHNTMTCIVRALQIGMQDGSIDDSYNPNELGAMIWGASKGIISLALQEKNEEGYNPAGEFDVNFNLMVQNFITLLNQGLTKK